jgi:hypothetical protein
MMGKANRKFYSLSQYKAPFCYELSGKHFHIFLDDGSEYSLFFLDGENLQYVKKGEAFQWDSYECMKGDDTTYFVHVKPYQFAGKVNHSWILDLAQNLVTLIITEEGVIPASERLIRVTPVFGAIKAQGRQLTGKRHSFTDRMVGRHIYWHYNPGFSIQHIYHKPTLYRLPQYDVEGMKKRYEAATDPEERARLEAYLDRFERTKESYPFCEEPCFHIMISDTMNLFCFCEENETLTDPKKAIGGGGLILLQDIERLTDVGLGYGLGEYYMLSAYGVENENGDEVDSLVAPYDETRLQTIPCIYSIDL